MKVLLVEDRQAISGQLMEMLHDKSNFDISLANESRAAIAQLNSSIFDIALIDLELDTRQRGEYQGIQLGSKIRERLPDILMIMYSADIEKGQEEAFDCYNECLAAGADQVISRRWLQSTTPKSIKTEIAKWIKVRTNGKSEAISVERDSDIQTEAVLEKVGGDIILKEILRKTLPGYSVHKIEPIGGGFTGATILRVHSSSSKKGPIEARNVIKISSSEFSLSEELKRKPFQGSVLDNKSMTPRSRKPFKVGKWNIFSVAEVREALPLNEFLVKRKPTSRNKNVINKVISRLLVEPAYLAKQPGNSTVKHLELRFSFLAEIQNSMQILKDYSQTQCPNAESDFQIVSRYLHGLEKGFFPLSSSCYRVAVLHGDFHTRNVLINKDGDAFLIDFGRGGIYPRLYDFANLEVDVIINLFDGTNGMQWDISRLDRWEKFVKKSFPISREELEYNEDCICYTRKRLHEALDKELDLVSENEYTEMLIFQLLRYIRFQNISLPKRILAVKWLTILITRFGLSK
jgi:DNA-binding NarL/FixJ family response regulator